jgi:hypothetical protein
MQDLHRRAREGVRPPLRRPSGAAFPDCWDLTISPYVFARGTRSRSRLTALVPSSSEKKVMPVTLPPDWRKFVTRPIFPGSAPVMNTTGMVVLAFFVAGWTVGGCARGRRLSPQIAYRQKFLNLSGASSV